MEGKGKGQGHGKGKKLEPIQDMEERRIVFSKLKGELFKEAAEISELWGIELALIVFSLDGDDVFTYVSPAAHSAVNIGYGASSNGRRFKHGSDTAALRRELQKVEKKLEAEKKAIATARKRSEDYLKGLSLEELEQLQEKVQELKRGVEARSMESRSKAVPAPSSSSMSGLSTGPAAAPPPPAPAPAAATAAAEETDDDGEAVSYRLP